MAMDCPFSLHPSPRLTAPVLKFVERDIRRQPASVHPCEAPMPRPNITTEELETVRAAAQAVSQVSGGDTPKLRAARFAELQAVLAKLRRRHGEHPVLLETEADFTQPAIAAVAIYERAEQAAIKHRMPTLTIRLSLARLLLEELNSRSAARAVLLACAEELPYSTEKRCAAWTKLLVACEGQ
jgi:hypothetical protein